MYYNSALSKMIENAFAFPHLNLTHTSQTANFVYDSIETSKDGSTTISVVIPGFAKEDLQLNINDNKLVLSSKPENKNLKRSWTITDSADIKNISAECKNGILTINIPVKAKPDKSRTVEIK